MAGEAHAIVNEASGPLNHTYWSRLDGALGKVEDTLALLAGLVAVAMTCAILFDVLSRVVSNQSVGWGTDLTEMFMYLLTYAAVGFVARHNANVRVDLVIEHLSLRINRRLSVVSTLLALCFALLLTTQGWNAWLDSVARGKATSSVHLPQAWFAFIIPVGSFLLALELAIILARHIHAIRAERRLAESSAKPALAAGSDKRS